MQTQGAQVANSQQSVPGAGAQPQVGGASDPNSAFNQANPAASSAAQASSPTLDGGLNPGDNPTQVAGDGQTDNVSTLTREQMARELERVRREAADHRTARRALEQEKAERERAQMTREERLAADLADAERVKSELLIKHQERAMQYEVQLHAAKLGLIDPEAAVKLLDTSRIEYDADGSPKNIGKLLQELAAAKPYLVAPTGAGATHPTRQPTDASPTNPASGSGVTQTFTESQIAAMTPQEWKKHRAAIFQAQREGRIRN